jgi:hypothetical protein
MDDFFSNYKEMSFDDFQLEIIYNAVKKLLSSDLIDPNDAMILLDFMGILDQENIRQMEDVKTWYLHRIYCCIKYDAASLYSVEELNRIFFILSKYYQANE